MKIEAKGEIVCRSITIENDDGKPCIKLYTDEKGGRIELSDFTDNKYSGITIAFLESKDPFISFFKGGNFSLGIGILSGSGFIQILGADKKVKHLLYVDDDMGKILSGNDVFERDNETLNNQKQS